MSVGSGGRYLVDADGAPFFLHGDTAWAIEVQLTNAQIDTYLNDRQTRGFNTVMFECCEHQFSTQSPAYNNIDGQPPFSSMSPVNWRFNEAYWQRIDYIVNQAKSRGMACIMFPAYLGFADTEEGWDTEVSAASTADLQAYGQALATRYTQGNVIWCLGGDAAGDSTLRAKQWNIVTGMRSVRTSDLITGHNARADGDAYSSWNGFAGFNLNSIYTGTSASQEPYQEAAAAYARSAPMPFFLIEDKYDELVGSDSNRVRRNPYQAVLSGACGHMFGNNPLWGFGANLGEGASTAAAVLASSLGTTITNQMAHVKALFTAYAWWRLVPKTDSSVVTSSLGSGTSRIVAARASDGTFAMIYSPGGGFDLNLAALTVAGVRARWFNPIDGTYTAATGSPFANTGVRNFAPGAERVLVLDAAS